MLDADSKKPMQRSGNAMVFMEVDLNTLSREEVVSQASTCHGMVRLLKAFRTWFDKNPGKSEHPHLGELMSLAADIDAIWNEDDFGTNFISFIIKTKTESSALETPAGTERTI